MMAPSVTSLVDEIVALLASAGTPGRAEQERRYLKSDLYFLGASHAETCRIARTVARREHLDRAATLALAQALWGPPVFERRAAAATILEVGAGALLPEDLPLLERLLRESGTWALVDDLAASVVGEIVARYPERVCDELDRWAADRDFWIRRASLLAELIPLKGGAPMGPFARRADSMLDETEFFIRKAIGWVLREVGKRRPAEVVAWLERRTDRASGVTMREAVKYLPAPDGVRLMRAYTATGKARRTAGAGHRRATGRSLSPREGLRTRRTRGPG
jgi:3-methyladenine DNA glycosylase AlkD